MTGRPKNDEAAFWSKVNVVDAGNCWLWKRALRNGYGNFCINRVSTYAHRFAYEQTHGAIPDGMQILHRCNEKRCCNPAHLRVGTPAENTRDAYADGLICVRIGEEHHRSRLKARQVLEIHRDGRIYSAIAADYGIAITTVSSIKNGYTWSHITGGRHAKAA